MGIGKRIKEARENLGLTQTELGELIGVTGSAITNYEKETSHPKESIMYKLFEALNVDANYLFQDVVNIPKKVNDVTLSEFEHIKKYRTLDSHGKEMVNFVLNKEFERLAELEKEKNKDSHILETDNITSPDNLFAALSPDDLSAIEQGAKLLRAKAFGFEEGDAMPHIEESADAHKPPSVPPDISALAPENLKVLEEGMKLLRTEKKA